MSHTMSSSQTFAQYQLVTSIQRGGMMILFISMLTCVLPRSARLWLKDYVDEDTAAAAAAAAAVEEPEESQDSRTSRCAQHLYLKARCLG